MVFLLLSPVFLTELCSFWYGLKDLFTLYKLGTKLSLTVKTDDVTKGTWIRTGGYGRLRAVQGRMGQGYLCFAKNPSPET